MHKTELLVFNPFLKPAPTLAFVVPINGTIPPALQNKHLQVSCA